MSASHHDREEETLIAYFQQMLAEVDDEEFDGEVQASAGDLQAKPTAASVYTEQSNHQVLANANAVIEAAHRAPAAPAASAATAAPAAAHASAATAASVDDESETHDGMANPSGGLEHISTRDMLAREMVMAAENVVVENAMLPHSPASYDQQNTSEYQSSHSSESYGYSTVDPALELASAIEPEFEPEPQLQSQYQSQTANSVDYAAPKDSLQRLLSTIDTTAVAEPAVETKVETATAVAEPVVETKVETAVAEPVVETKVDTAVAEPVVETAVAEPVVETAVAEPVVETKVETATAVAEPVVETKVETATAVAEPVVETKVETAVAEPVVAPVVTPAPVVAPAPVVTPVQTKQVIKTPAQLAQERMSSRLQQIAATWQNVDLGEQFQVLFFLVQGVRFAVPLIDLGGIFECEKITQLFGKPSWFMGITDVRGSKINIVDTLRWVMPEIGDSPDKYPYLISLGTSSWSIGCDVLEGNRTLNRSQVKWREIPGSRPWLAGIVTSDKCALLHVKALISLFEAGADIEDLSRDLEEREKAKGK